MSEQKKQDEQKKAPNKFGPDGDDFNVAGGKTVLDKGESVVNKMNREKAIFDKDLFFQDLFENYLVCVQRDEVRQRPKSGLILRWNMSTTFDDFLSDAIENIDRQIESIKFAKSVNAHKLSATDGDFFLSEAKIDAGSAAVGKKFGVEDYDALYEILRKSKETITDYQTGNIQLILNKKTGRARVANKIGD